MNIGTQPLFFGSSEGQLDESLIFKRQRRLSDPSSLSKKVTALTKKALQREQYHFTFQRMLLAKIKKHPSTVISKYPQKETNIYLCQVSQPLGENSLVEDLINEANIKFSQKDYVEANRLYKLAEPKMDNISNELLSQMGYVKLQVQDYQGAKSLYFGLLNHCANTNQPVTINNCIHMGIACQRSGEHQLAEQYFNIVWDSKMNEVNVDVADFCIEFALVQFSLKKYSKANQFLSKAVEIYAALNESMFDQSLPVAAKVKLYNKEYSEADRFYGLFIKDYRESPFNELILEWAIAKCCLNEFEEAKKLFCHVLSKKNHRMKECLVGIAFVETALKNFNQADFAYSEIERLRAESLAQMSINSNMRTSLFDSIEYLAFGGRIKYECSKNELAEILFKTAFMRHLKNKDKTPPPHVFIDAVFVEFKLKKYSEAYSLINLAFEIYPETKTAYHLSIAGRLKMLSGEFELANVLFDQAIQAYEKGSEPILVLAAAATVKYKLGLYREAGELMESIFVLSKEKNEKLYRSIFILNAFIDYKNENYKKAEKFIRKVFIEDPKKKTVDNLIFAAATSYKLCDFNETIRYCKLALGIPGSDKPLLDRTIEHVQNMITKEGLTYC